MCSLTGEKITCQLILSFNIFFKKKKKCIWYCFVKAFLKFKSSFPLPLVSILATGRGGCECGEAECSLVVIVKWLIILDVKKWWKREGGLGAYEAFVWFGLLLWKQWSWWWKAPSKHRTQPSSSVLTCLFSLCPNFSLFPNINLILFLLPNFFSLLSPPPPPFLGCVWKYKNKRKFEGVTFLLLNRISCFLSLAGNSCLASLQGCRARMLI